MSRCDAQDMLDGVIENGRRYGMKHSRKKERLDGKYQISNQAR